MFRRTASSVGFMIASAAFPAAASEPVGNFPAQTYSSLCIHPQSGDVLGEAVVLLPGVDTALVYLSADGVLSKPLLLQVKESRGRRTASSATGEVFQFRRGDAALELDYLDGRISRTGKRSVVLKRVQEPASPESCTE